MYSSNYLSVKDLNMAGKQIFYYLCLMRQIIWHFSTEILVCYYEKDRFILQLHSFVTFFLYCADMVRSLSSQGWRNSVNRSFSDFRIKMTPTSSTLLARFDDVSRTSISTSCNSLRLFILLRGSQPLWYTWKGPEVYLVITWQINGWLSVLFISHSTYIFLTFSAALDKLPTCSGKDGLWPVSE